MIMFQIKCSHTAAVYSAHDRTRTEGHDTTVGHEGPGCTVVGRGGRGGLRFPYVRNGSAARIQPNALPLNRSCAAWS